MTIKIEGIKMNQKMFDIAMQAAKEAALTSHVFTGAWFNSEEEYEEWAGDVVDELIFYACKALGITFDFDNPTAPDVVFCEGD